MEPQAVLALVLALCAVLLLLVFAAGVELGGEAEKRRARAAGPPAPPGRPAPRAPRRLAW